MADLLYVGDPHVTPAELPDAEALMGRVFDIVKNAKVDGVVFLGDAHHFHGIMHLVVMAFWLRWVNRLAELTHVYLMVGNHDRPAGQPYVHSMLPHKGVNKRVHVIDDPSTFEEIPGTVFIPYMDDAEEFVKVCRDYNDSKHCPMVVCHQTFAGSQYENGFYAKDGINPDLIPQEMILSGHIHRPQRNGKVWYVGAPRWRTASDANTERRLWLMTQSKGVMTVKAQFDTGEVCRRIIHDEEKETDADPLEPELYDTKKDDVTLTLTGSAEWLATKVPVRERQGFRVRTVKTGAAAAPRIKESEGVPAAFKKFVTAYQPKNKTPITVLEKLATDRIVHAG